MNKIKIPDLEGLVWLPEIFRLLRSIQTKLFSANMNSLIFSSTSVAPIKEEMEQLRSTIKETDWQEFYSLSDEDLFELLINPSFSVMVKNDKKAKTNES